MGGLTFYFFRAVLQNTFHIVQSAVEEGKSVARFKRYPKIHRYVRLAYFL